MLTKMTNRSDRPDGMLAGRVSMRKARLGYRQPLIAICGHSEQGKTGIALTAAALNPDMINEPGCPPNFLRLFETTNKREIDEAIRLVENGEKIEVPLPVRRITPIKAVNIVDGEKDTDRLLTTLECFPEKMVQRVFLMDTYPENQPYNVEESIRNFESFSQDQSVQATPDNCNVYDTFSGFVDDLNDQQKVVSRRHAEEELKRKMKAGNPVGSAAILSGDELAKPAQFEWEWRNEHLGMFLRNVKGFACMSILIMKMKKLYTGAQWDGQSYQVASPPQSLYMENIRISLNRTGSKVKVTVVKNRYSSVISGMETTFELGPWTMAEILLWLYGLDTKPIAKSS